MRNFFGLRHIKAKELGVRRLYGEAVRPEQVLFPSFAVLPMGFFLALDTSGPPNPAPTGLDAPLGN